MNRITATDVPVQVFLVFSLGIYPVLCPHLSVTHKCGEAEPQPWVSIPTVVGNGQKREVVPMNPWLWRTD